MFRASILEILVKPKSLKMSTSLIKYFDAICLMLADRKYILNFKEHWNPDSCARSFMKEMYLTWFLKKILSLRFEGHYNAYYGKIASFTVINLTCTASYRNRNLPFYNFHPAKLNVLCLYF